jgi:hypothetical protein
MDAPPSGGFTGQLVFQLHFGTEVPESFGLPGRRADRSRPFGLHSKAEMVRKKQIDDNHQEQVYQAARTVLRVAGLTPCPQVAEETQDQDDHKRKSHNAPMRRSRS